MSLRERLEDNSPCRFLRLIRKVFFTRRWQRYWSQYGEDIVLNRVLNLKQKGIYVDVGCYHPVKYSNTYKLHRHGWRGVNIDLDSVKIQAFRWCRPRDANIVAAISETEGTLPLWSAGFYSLTSTLDPATAGRLKKNPHGQGRVREVKTSTLTQILDQTEFRNLEIDVLSVDVEGHELSVLKSLDFNRYLPKILIVESHKRSLEEVMESDLYQFIKQHGYTLFNWTGPSLLFIHPRDRKGKKAEDKASHD
jgi:FkbM family methyltransferase